MLTMRMSENGTTEAIANSISESTITEIEKENAITADAIITENDITDEAITEIDTTTEQQEQTEQQIDVENMLSDAIDGMNELDEEAQNAIYHDWGTENITVRALLKRYSEKKIILPLCQRLYIWNEKQRLSLLDSIKQNLPCGTIIVTEYNNTQFLLDGLQRTTSLMILSNNKKLSKEERKMILDYKVTLTIVYDVSAHVMKNYFNLLNSGVALASSVKERSKLTDELNETILKISSHEFFRNIADNANATFSKSHHHELIAMNTLLAVCNIDIAENKAKSLCSDITANAEAITENAEKAITIIDRLQEIYNIVALPDVKKRSLNANFVGILSHVLVKTDYSNNEIASLINYIFADKRAISSYAETTSNGAGDAYKCQQRYNLMIELLENPQQLTEINDKALASWAKGYKDTPLKSHADKGIIIAIEDLQESEVKALYLADRDGKKEVWNKIIESTYNVLLAKENAKEDVKKTA